MISIFKSLLGGVIQYMKRHMPEKREFEINRCKKIERCTRRRRARCHNKSFNYRSFNEPELPSFMQRRFETPIDFSFQMNFDEMVGFFDKVNLFLRKVDTKGVQIFFDLSKITSISCDAILYLIAVCYNMKNVRVLPHPICGNYPDDSECKDYILKIGFLKFMRANDKNSYPKLKDDMIIIHGDTVRQDKACSIIDTLIRKYGVSKKKCTGLVRMIIELMANTKNHAYESGGFYPHWYMFCDYRDTIVNFTFLDTGLGIPKTVRKRILENFSMDNSQLIESAFLGQDDRTRLKLHYRGYGLPAINEVVRRPYFRGFCVTSGSGEISINDNLVERTEHAHSLSGTLYYWSIDAKALEEA